MSSALLDCKSLENPNPNGQISALFSLFISSINHSKNTMNSWNQNSDPFGGKQPASGSGSSRPKPRLMKLRKHASSTNPKSTLFSESGNIDPGFNPFKPSSDNLVPEMGASFTGNLKFGNVGDEAFVFGASKGNDKGFNENKVLDDMRKLKIGSNQEFVNPSNPVFNLNASERDSGGLAKDSIKGVSVFGIAHKKSSIDEGVNSDFQDSMRKLKIEGSANVVSCRSENVKSNSDTHNETHVSFKSGSNHVSSFNKSVATELPNEMKKLNIKDSRQIDGSSFDKNADDLKTFVYENANTGCNSLAGSSANILFDKTMNLNMKDWLNSDYVDKKEVKFSASDKSSFDFRSNTTASYNLDGRAEKVLSNEMERLNLTRKIDNVSSEGQISFESISTTPFTKTNFGYKKFQDVRSSIPTEEFAFQAGNSCELPHVDRPKKKDDLGTPHVDFTVSNQNESIFTGLVGTNLEFSAERESAKDARSKKKRGKLKKPTPARQDFILRKSSGLQEHQDESFESYSPMDVSPYHETVIDNEEEYSRETSVASEEALHLFSTHNPSSEPLTTAVNEATDEDLVIAAQHLNINGDDSKFTEIKMEDSPYRISESFDAEVPTDGFDLGTETESFVTADALSDYNSNDTFVTAADTEVSSSLRTERQGSDDSKHFSCRSSSEDVGSTSFTFAASFSAHSQASSASMRHHKKKNRFKIAHESYSSTPNVIVQQNPSSMQYLQPSETSSLLSPRWGQKGDLPTSFSKMVDKSEAVKDHEIEKDSLFIPAASIAAQEACDKWRLRGNQAYANGDMKRAEDNYSQGINCISPHEKSKSCLRALMLCYSNRAATRMSLGRLREALGDCRRAAEIDPKFLRVQVRAANCYLALGDLEAASLHFAKCLQSGSEACVDRKLILEASEGLEKAQKVSESMEQSAELVQRKTSDAAECALGVISEALTTSSYSEKLLEMKAEALFMLRKYEEVIQLCEQTLASAQINHAATTADHLSNLECFDAQKDPSFRLWRWRLIITSYFSLGRLEAALEFLKKQEKSVSTSESESMSLESSIPLVGTIRELVRHKAAGNKAFQSGNYAEAVEHYTASLVYTVESRPFAAVCFCNRAAAYKAMGQVIDAIADCSIAIALDGDYLKAISRRASLFEMIRDYDQATKDMFRVVSLIMKQVEDKSGQFGPSDKLSVTNELRQAQQQLSAMEEAAKEEIPLNMYLILGVDPSVTASEIKKAYRKAALRHHPDKACQSLARSEDDGLGKEVMDEVHKDADRLFKMIGEAYAILSDSAKRSRYDVEEEMRNVQKRGSGGSRMHMDVQSKYPYERESSSRRQWREVWRSYRNFESRGSETYRSSRY